MLAGDDGHGRGSERTVQGDRVPVKQSARPRGFEQHGRGLVPLNGFKQRPIPHVFREEIVKVRISFECTSTIAPLSPTPILANACGVASPASTSAASTVPCVDGLNGAAAIRIEKLSGAVAVASADTGNQRFGTSNDSAETLPTPA